MKIPCTLKNALLIIRDRFGMSFASKGLGYLAAYLLLLSLLARYKLSCYQTTPLLTILALADIILLKTTCHFLLLLVGFNTLTYRKELQLTPYTCGSSYIYDDTGFCHNYRHRSVISMTGKKIRSAQNVTDVF